METESKLRLADVFVTISDPRQAGKVEHDLVELLVIAVNAVLVGADRPALRRPSGAEVPTTCWQ